jgi:thymidylate synthase
MPREINGPTAKPIMRASCRPNSRDRADVRIVAQQVGVSPGELFWVGGDVHLYPNHIDMPREVLRREPQPFPNLMMRRRPGSIDEYRIRGFEVIGCHSIRNSGPVAV